MPGPRQNASGAPHTSSVGSSTVARATIKFKTSSTLLKNLFPSQSYSFAVRDTVAIARFSIESLRNIAWLGGGGYDLLALYVDGVNYTKKDGKVLQGTYCPVMFENLTDPILSGREELGMPKVFSDIDIVKTDGDYKASVSWRGNKWAEFEWSGLQNQLPAASDCADFGKGLLIHKWIPATGQAQRGKPDADYDVFIPTYGQGPPHATRTTMKSSRSHFKIWDSSESKFPTLHHIVARLAEIPVFEILEGSLSETQEVDDLFSAQILD